MSLHLVFSAAGWRACAARLQDADATVLLGDGVYVATQPQPAGLHVLSEDAHIRGVPVDASHSLISYEALVALCIEHHPVVSWND